jgi:hypothetical protein
MCPLCSTDTSTVNERRVNQVEYNVCAFQFSLGSSKRTNACMHVCIDGATDDWMDGTGDEAVRHTIAHPAMMNHPNKLHEWH